MAKLIKHSYSMKYYTADKKRNVCKNSSEKFSKNAAMWKSQWHGVISLRY